MPSEAFHESAHSSLSHSIRHQIPFKHIPQCPDEGSYISWNVPLTLASEASMYFFVWPGVLHLTTPEDTAGPPVHPSWLGHCPLRWAFTVPISKHTCIKTHLSSNTVFICGPSTRTGNDINACSFILLMSAVVGPG